MASVSPVFYAAALVAAVTSCYSSMGSVYLNWLDNNRPLGFKLLAVAWAANAFFDIIGSCSMLLSFGAFTTGTLAPLDLGCRLQAVGLIFSGIGSALWTAVLAQTLWVTTRRLLEERVLELQGSAWPFPTFHALFIILGCLASAVAVASPFLAGHYGSISNNGSFWCWLDYTENPILIAYGLLLPCAIALAYAAVLTLLLFFMADLGSGFAVLSLGTTLISSVIVYDVVVTLHDPNTQIAHTLRIVFTSLKGLLCLTAVWRFRSGPPRSLSSSPTENFVVKSESQRKPRRLAEDMEQRKPLLEESRAEQNP